MADFDLVSSEDPVGNKAGEFSGVGGLIAPPPHFPTADEALMLSYQVTQHPVASE